MDIYSNHNELHGFAVGTFVVDENDPSKRVREVIAMSGGRKDDRVKLDKPNSPWMIAGRYRRTRRNRKT